MMEPHGEQIQKRMNAYLVVLCLRDTTELDGITELALSAKI